MTRLVIATAAFRTQNTIETLVTAVYPLRETMENLASRSPLAMILNVSDMVDKIKLVVPSVNGCDSIPYHGCDRAGISKRTDKGAMMAASNGKALTVL